MKAGLPDGTSRGFAFIAPTVKLSKVTGELAAYRWRKLDVVTRDLDADADASCKGLAAPIRERRAPRAATAPEGLLSASV